MTIFKNLKDIILDLKNKIELEGLTDLDGKQINVMILNPSNLEAISSLAVPVLLISLNKPITGERLSTDEFSLSIPDNFVINLSLIHYHISNTNLIELLCDLGDKVLNFINSWENDLVLDKSLTFEVEFNSVKEVFYGLVNFDLTLRLNLAKINI